MNRNYKFHNPDSVCFVWFSVVEGTDLFPCNEFMNKLFALPFMDSGSSSAGGTGGTFNPGGAFYRADMISNHGYSAATAMMPHWSVSTRNPGTNFAYMNRRTFEGIYGKGAYDYQIAENAAENASNGNVSNDNELFRIYAYDANDNLIGIDIYYLTNKKNGFNGRMDDLMKDDGATGGGIPHGGIMFYTEDGLLLQATGLGSKNIIYTVGADNITKFQTSYNTLNPASNPLTINDAQLLASVYGNSTYEIVMPGENSVLGYSIPGWGSWIGMFATMGLEGGITGRINGSLQTSKPSGWKGLQGHYSSSPGIVGFWESTFTTRKFQPWW